MASAGAGEAVTAEELLAAARGIIAQSEYCWAVTASAEGRANARVMGRVASVPDEDEWTVWFLVSRRSRKATEVGDSGCVTAAYSNSTLTKYAVLLGPAVLVEDQSVIARLWQERWNSLFAQGKHDPDIAFIKLEPDRMEVFVEGMVSKHRDRPYRGGRQKHWIKVKNRKHPAFDRVKEALQLR